MKVIYPIIGMVGAFAMLLVAAKSKTSEPRTVWDRLEEIELEQLGQRIESTRAREAWESGDHASALAILGRLSVQLQGAKAVQVLAEIEDMIRIAEAS